MNKKEYILCAAIHFDDEKVYAHQPLNIKTGVVICGRKHRNVFIIYSLTDLEMKTKTLGFITSMDRFVDRKEAYQIAFDAGQLDHNKYHTKDGLLSEDLYSDELY